MSDAATASPPAAPAASVSTHILDTGLGRPAGDVAVSLAARSGSGAAWVALGGSRTDADGRCKDLPALPAGTAQARLDFGTEAYFTGEDRSAERSEDRSEVPSADQPRGQAGNRDHAGTRDRTDDRADDRTDGRTGDRVEEPRRHAPRARDGGPPFFPEVTITFTVTPGEHYHVPLLLSPFGYSVYRGS